MILGTAIARGENNYMWGCRPKKSIELLDVYQMCVFIYIYIYVLIYESVRDRVTLSILGDGDC